MPLYITIFFCLAATGLAQDTVKIRHLPAQPRILLDMLPDAPKGWELTRSEASHQFTGILNSRAVREYSEVLSAVLRGSVEPMKVRVEIRDTCYNPNEVLPFTMKAEDARSKELRPGHWKSNPAILVDEKDGVRETVRVLFEKRFLVKVTYVGKDYRAAKQWLQALNVDALKRYQPFVFRKPPVSFEMEKIDELRKSRSRSYRMTLPGQKPPERPVPPEKFAIPGGKK